MWDRYYLHCHTCIHHQLCSGNLVLCPGLSDVSSLSRSYYYVCNTTMYCAKNGQWLFGCTPSGRMIERVRLYVPVPQVTLHDSQAFHWPTSLSEGCICSAHIFSMPISML